MNDFKIEVTESTLAGLNKIAEILGEDVNEYVASVLDEHVQQFAGRL